MDTDPQVTVLAPGWYPQAEGGYQYWTGSVWVPEPPTAPPTSRVAPYATQSFAVPTISGLAVGALIAAFLFPLLGIILGYVARGDIGRSGGMKTGSGMATAAIILGWIGVAITVIWIVLLVKAGMAKPSYRY